jgi:hypothetical protein
VTFRQLGIRWCWLLTLTNWRWSSQYTEIDERRELLEIVANKCQQLRTSAQAAGDLLEAAFRLTKDLSSTGIVLLEFGLRISTSFNVLVCMGTRFLSLLQRCVDATHATRFE